jgi:AcrR family transcriptional regulator
MPMAEMVKFAPLALPPAAAAEEWEAIREAVLDLVFESGYEAATMESICERAGIGPTRFKQLLRDRDDCFVQVHASNMVFLEKLAFDSYNAEESWREGLRASAYATGYYLREHLREVSFGPAIRPSAAGAEVEARYSQMLQRVVELIDAGRHELEDPDSISRAVAEGAVGSVKHFITAGLKDGGRYPTVEELVPQLMYFAVRPYLGVEAAEEELTIPPPPRQSQG